MAVLGWLLLLLLLPFVDDEEEAANIFPSFCLRIATFLLSASRKSSARMDVSFSHQFATVARVEGTIKARDASTTRRRRLLSLSLLVV